LTLLVAPAGAIGAQRRMQAMAERKSDPNVTQSPKQDQQRIRPTDEQRQQQGGGKQPIDYGVDADADDNVDPPATISPTDARS
jgi:hypothetical protein